MLRVILGGLVGGLILFIVGFIFWATPLAEIAYKRAGEAESAAVQLSLAQNLSQSGTGTYIVPDPGTAQGTVLYGQGPVAIVHFNTGGFPVEDMGMILIGFIFALVSGLALAFGLAAIAGNRPFGATARLVILFSLAITIWTILAQPVFNHFGWTYWVYSFIAETIALVLAGLVIARWFLPTPTEPARQVPAREPEAPGEAQA